MAADLEYTKKALSVPSRDVARHHRSWNCGPDTLARFFFAAGLDIGDPKDIERYIEITENCPRSCGKPTSNAGFFAVGGLSCLSTACLALGWEGYSDTVFGLISGALAMAPFAIEKLNEFYGIGNVGPTPKWLAQYANGIMNSENWRGEFVHKEFEKAHKLKDFLIEELKSKPVIVLVNYGPLLWHYFLLVDYDQTSEEFKCIDGPHRCYAIDSEELFRSMDFHKDKVTKYIQQTLDYLGRWPLAVDIGRFNIIYLSILAS